MATGYRPTCPKSSITGGWASASSTSPSSPPGLPSFAVSTFIPLLPKLAWGVDAAFRSLLLPVNHRFTDRSSCDRSHSRDRRAPRRATMDRRSFARVRRRILVRKSKYPPCPLLHENSNTSFQSSTRKSENSSTNLATRLGPSTGRMPRSSPSTSLRGLSPSSQERFSTRTLLLVPTAGTEFVDNCSLNADWHPRPPTLVSACTSQSTPVVKIEKQF